MSEHSAEKDAPERGHVLTVTKGEDWFPDQPDWSGSITCLNVAQCNGWWECGKPHEVGGVSAADGPYENDCSGEHGVSTDRAGHLPWCDEDEFEFHGVLHTWRWGYGWTVPYPGCVVQTSDAISDAAYDIGQQYGEGDYLVDDEWDDTSCTLIYAGRVTPPAETGDPS